MHTFMNRFHQGGKYSSQISSHQAELRRREKLLIKNVYLFHPYRMTIYILTEFQVVVKIARKNIVQKKCAVLGGANHYAEKYFKGSEREKKISCGW